MKPNTHLAIDARLCGSPRALFVGGAEVDFDAIPDMRADEYGLVHGGFLFGLADYAAMLAVNEPNVVLGSAETRFVAPVVVGDSLRATARVVSSDGKKRHVEVQVDRRADGREERVFEGTFVCFIPSRHVLESRRKEGAP